MEDLSSPLPPIEVYLNSEVHIQLFLNRRPKTSKNGSEVDHASIYFLKKALEMSFKILLSMAN